MNDTNDAGTTAGAAPAANSNAEAETAARVAALEAELADHKDRLLRALAEVENIRRRAERERAEAVKYAVTGFAKDLLAVADNLRRALDSMPEAEIADGRTRSLLDGVAATERELLAAFGRHGRRSVAAGLCAARSAAAPGDGRGVEAVAGGRGRSAGEPGRAVVAAPPHAYIRRKVRG